MPVAAAVYERIVAAVFSIALVVVAIYVWIRSSYLSLPLPPLAPFLAVLVPILNYLATGLPPASPVRLNPELHPNGQGNGNAALVRSSSSSSSSPPFVPYPVRSVISLLVDTILISISSTYLQRWVQACNLSVTWSILFQRKAATEIRRIQDAFQCCGYRSTHDLAWPFPDATHSARSCEETFGRTRPCLLPWAREDETLLGLTVGIGAACVLYKLVILFVVHFQHMRRRPATANDGEAGRSRARLLGIGNDPVPDEPVHEPYRDDPEERPPASDAEGEEGVIARLQNGSR